MKIEEYARKWLQEQERGKLPDSVIDSLTNPERERDIAQGIRIGLKAAYLHIYECPLDEFESFETQQLIVRVCSMLGGELEEMEDNKRDLPGVGE